MPDVRIITKGRGGETIADAAILAAYPDGRRLTGYTDANGELKLDLYRTDQPMTLLAAAKGYLPCFDERVPSSDLLVMQLDASTDGRCGILFMKSTGYIPGVDGRLNPVREPNGRRFLYVDNLAINGKLAYPAAEFDVGEELHLLDVYGVETTIKFLVAEPEFSLIEYTTPTAYGGE